MTPTIESATDEGTIVSAAEAIIGKSLRVPDRFNPDQLRRLLDVLGWQP